MKRRLKQLSAFLICACVLQTLLLCGCSTGDGTAAGSGNTNETVNTAEYDLAANEWKAFSRIEESERKYTVGDYLADICQTPEQGMTGGEGFSATEHEMYYRIRHYYRSLEDGGENEGESDEPAYEQSYYLYSLNTSTLEKNVVKLDFHCKDGMGETQKTEVYELAQALLKENGSVENLDAADGKLCIFALTRDQASKEITHYYAVWTDNEGIVERIVDLMPAIREGIVMSQDWSMALEPICGAQGYYYIINRHEAEILAADGDGKSLGLVTLQDSADKSVMNTCKSPDGVPVFEYYSLNGSTVIFSLNGTEKTVLYTGESENANIRNIDDMGNVLYLSNRKLVWWDAAHGTGRLIYDMNRWIQCDALLHDTENEISMIFEKEGKYYLYKFHEAQEGIEDDRDDIVLLGRIDFNYTETQAKEYSETHPDTPITVEIPDEVLNLDPIAFNRLVEEMKAGKGPDILVINREELVVLEDAGLLKDLSDVLTEDIRKQVFPAALRHGTVDGKLYGIAYSLDLDTCFVSNEIWQGDSWTLEDLLKTVAQMEAEGRAPKKILDSSRGETPYSTLYYLCERTLAGSPFVDLENMTCNFETEEFYDLLRVCKKYSQPVDRTAVGEADDSVKEVAGGDALIYVCSGGVKQYAEAREWLGEGFHPVGYPTGGEFGSFSGTYECIVVNAETEHWDVIQDFLRQLLGEEGQKNLSDSVRRDIVNNSVILNGLDGSELDHAYVDEYLALIDRDVIAVEVSEISEIISEEAEMYFAGVKTEQQVAQAIQNRVQLYLDENG